MTAREIWLGKLQQCSAIWGCLLQIHWLFTSTHFFSTNKVCAGNFGIDDEERPTEQKSRLTSGLRKTYAPARYAREAWLLRLGVRQIFMNDSNPPIGPRGSSSRNSEMARPWLSRVSHVSGELDGVLVLSGHPPGVLARAWRDSLELAFMIILYPLAIPALVMCGGPHNCGGSPLTILSVPVLLLTLIAAGSGIRLAFNFLRRIGSNSRQSDTV